MLIKRKGVASCVGKNLLVADHTTEDVQSVTKRLIRLQKTHFICQQCITTTGARREILYRFLIKNNHIFVKRVA